MMAMHEKGEQATSPTSGAQVRGSFWLNIWTTWIILGIVYSIIFGIGFFFAFRTPASGGGQSLPNLFDLVGAIVAPFVPFAISLTWGLQNPLWLLLAAVFFVPAMLWGERLTRRVAKSRTQKLLMNLGILLVIAVSVDFIIFHSPVAFLGSIDELFGR